MKIENEKKVTTIYFIKVWLLIFVCSILTSRYLLYHLFDMENEDNGWFLTIVSGLAFVYSLKFVFILCISSISIFLNKYESIRKNSFYSLLTYCLIPFATLFCFIVGDLFEKNTDFDTLLTGWKFMSSMILPHLVISLIFFFHFRRMLKNKAFSNNTSSSNQSSKSN